ncbi:hypothetical protein QUA46_25790 [Microcoleus sp. MON2_D6]|uniref:hypothetical protein n=1 Tax=unclassified Microcoleus TaxID=2642155 RepID=UPI002FD414C1
MQEIIEQIEKLVANDRFNMKEFYNILWPVFSVDQAIANSINTLLKQHKISEKMCKDIFCGIFRHSFLIELAKPDVTTTKFRTRWYTQLDEDPRKCSFEECLEIAKNLISILANGWLNEPINFEALSLILEYSLLPYELPIDYIERPNLKDLNTRIHRKDNIQWMVDENIIKTLKLRKYLTNSETSPDMDFFKEVIDNKIKVKTYLTDRVLTGLYKTNREKRWEVHPHSVHFAFRRECIAIEHELIIQLCYFEGFPEDFQMSLQKGGILPKETKISRCPITLEPLVFQKFREEQMSRTHGKSNFQVGHLNPLKQKVDNLNNPIIKGHTSKNIAWISQEGNRIQGDMSLEEVRNLLRQIVHNYESEELV